MNVYLDVRNLFDIGCILQGITTAAVLLLRSERLANRWLALLITGLTLQITDYFLSRSGIYYHHRWLYFMPLFFSWGFGPVLYQYVRVRSNATGSLSRWHFVPVAMQTVFYGVLMVQPLSTKSWFWLTVHKPYTRYVEYYVACLLMLYYLRRSWSIVRPQNPAEHWLSRSLIGLGVFYGVALIDPLVNALYLTPQATKFYLTAQVLPLLGYALALTGLFFDPPELRSKSPNAIVVKPEYREQIRKAIEDDKLYQDPELTLASLAQHVGLSPNVISRTINAGFDQSFADFINTYRINEVKRRLAAGDAARLTVLGLALDAGFASKTTFKRVFKEQTGHTPKQYAKMSQIILRDDANA